MKKPLIILLSILLTGLNLQAQPSVEYEYVPFPTSNAIWYERYCYYDFPNGCYEAYTITGEDTIMNDFIYKKLFSFRSAMFDPDNARYIGGIREDEKKRVYYRGEVLYYLKPSYRSMGSNGGGMFADEVLLYDFSLSIGDTLKAGNFTFPLTQDYPWGECLVVSSIDTISVGNTYRKKFTFELGLLGESKTVNSSKRSLPEYFGWLQWIEGIGNGLGLLYTTTEYPLSEVDPSNLICFEHNSVMLYCSYNPCKCFDDLSIDNTGFNLNPVKVYPNPVISKTIFFEFGELKVESIEIFNCTGIQTGKYLVGNQQEFSFSMANYPSGIYFYKVITTDNHEYKGKFIIQ